MAPLRPTHPSFIVGWMNDTAEPSTTSRVTAAWHASDDRRLTLTWTVPATVSADEPSDVDEAA
jgi:hypothetical protein